MNLASRERQKVIRFRMGRLVEDHGVALSAIAGKSNVDLTTVKNVYCSENRRKRIHEKNAEKLEKGLLALEGERGIVKRCRKCGRELPLSSFYVDRRAKDGLLGACKECYVKGKEERDRKGKNPAPQVEKELVPTGSDGGNAGREDGMNNYSEVALTKEIVKRVKAEDQPEVEPKYMAKWFGISEKQMVEIREGKHDSLLKCSKKPKPAESVHASVEALRGEVAALRNEVQTLILELGGKLPDLDDDKTQDKPRGK